MLCPQDGSPTQLLKGEEAELALFGTASGGIAITPDGTTVCVTNSASNIVSVIDTATHQA